MPKKLRGDRVRALAEKQGMNLTELHVHLQNYRPNLAWSTLSNIINGKQTPHMDIVQAIAIVLDTSTDYLMGNTDEPEVNSKPTLPVPELDIALMVGELNRQAPNVRLAITDIVKLIIQLATDAFSVQPNESSVTLEALREMIDTFPPAEQEVLLSAISRLREKQRQAEERKRQRQSDEDDVSNFGT